MSAISILFIALGLFTAYTLVVLVAGARRARAEGERVAPTASSALTGFVANFFDTLGIGSFAPTTAILRTFKLAKDEQIPGTLNAGYALAALFQSFLFIGAVDVDPKTLILMIGAAVLGAWVGAGLFSKWPRRNIQWGMGGALLIAGCLFIYKNIEGDPVGGMLIGLTGTRLLLALAGNFVLGIMMTIGVGLYAPCMLLVTMVGMNPTTAFPIMMGSCAFLMPIASTRFVKEKAVNLPVTIGLALSAVPGVWLAYKFFSGLDIATVRWLVAAVVLYTGIMLLRTAMREPSETIAAKAVAAEAGVGA